MVATERQQLERQDGAVPKPVVDVMALAMSQRVDAEIQCAGGVEAVVTTLNITPERDQTALQNIMYGVVQGRLARAISGNEEFTTAAAKGVEARISRGILQESQKEEEIRKAALAMAQRKVKSGIPEEQAERVRREMASLGGYVTSGRYDETSAAFKRNWKAREKQEALSDVELQAMYHAGLAEIMGGEVETAFGPLTAEDAQSISIKISPFNPNSAASKRIGDALKKNPKLLEAPPGTIIKQLKTQNGETSRNGNGHTVDMGSIVVVRNGEFNLGDPHVDISGLNWKTVKDGLVQHPSIAGVEIVNLHRVNKSRGETVRIELQYCPLYAPGSLAESSLIPDARGVKEIVGSRVGKKWIATQEALKHTADFTRAHGRTLEVVMTFADWGVLAGSPKAANAQVLRQHGEVYEEEARKMCQEIGVGYVFRKMSDEVGASLEKRGIGQFVVAKDSRTIDPNDDPRKMLANLGLSELDVPVGDQRQMEQTRRVLKEVIGASGGNREIARGLVGAYCVALPELVSGHDFHLGMERSTLLLDLSMLGHNRNNAALNVLVS